MTGRSLHPAAALLSALLLPILIACSDAETGGCTTAHVHQPLYYGNHHPTVVALDGLERLAIVMVTDDVKLSGNFCTGTLIADRWVVTARHCQSAKPLQVAFGSDATRPLLVLRTARAIPHPTRDLMLLELRRPAVISSLGLRPIARLDQNISKSWLGARAELAGFGQTESLSFGDLRFVDEPITLVDETSMRVDGSGQSGGCFGDSGGPLLVSDAGTTRIAGVLSRGSASCVNQDIYIRLDNIAAWLDEQMAAETPPEGCETLPRAGECSGSTAIWCSEDRLQARFCEAAHACAQVSDTPECALCR